MSAGVVQKGLTLKVGFGSAAYTGYVFEAYDDERPAGNEEPILDENGATLTKIIMDPRRIVNVGLIIKDTGGSITPPIHGVTVTLTDASNASVAFMCESGTVTHAYGATKLQMQLIKEDAMTYS